MSANDIVIEEKYPFPPERVWRALTDSDALADWLMPNNFEPRLGHRFQFRSKPMPGWRGVVDCEVIELDEPRCLAFTWTGDEAGVERTTIRFTLTPIPTGTLLRLEHNGFAEPWGKALSDGLRHGWGKMLAKRIPQVIDRFGPDGYQPLPRSENKANS